MVGFFDWLYEFESKREVGGGGWFFSFLMVVAGFYFFGVNALLVTTFCTFSILVPTFYFYHF